MTDYQKYFKTGTRENGDSFVTLNDDHPEWLQDAIRDAHQGTMPNDWIYAECLAAVESFDETGELEDMHEHADNRVDVYTKNLYQWAADMCLTDTWAQAESESSELGLSESEQIEKRIAGIQYCAILYIAETMRNACVEAGKEEAAE